MGQNKKIAISIQLIAIFFPDLVAEREGFEPPVPHSTTVFKTAAIDHSAISPVLHLRGLFP